jgi:subtilisin-like proprotein convertase family protein
MLVKQNWTARIAAIAAAGILAAIWSQAGVADAKPKLRTKTFSSGNVNLQIPEPAGIQAFPISSAIRVKVKGRIKDVNVAVRITIPDDRDLELIVVGPNVNGARLKEHAFRNDPKGADFGTGPASCAGTPTIFDSQAATPILQGLPPFAGSFRPTQSLNTLRGGRVDAKWSLELLDSFPGNIDGTPGAPGVLNCWKLTIRYTPEAKRT